MVLEPIESQVRDILASTYIHFLSISLLYYDHALNWTREVDHIWTKPKTLSSWLFIANRYLAFFANIVITVFNQTRLVSSSESCKSFRLFQQVHFVLTEGLVAAIMVLRVYALYSLSKKLLYFLLGFIFLVIPICVWALLGQKQEVQPENPFVGCTLGLTDATAYRIAVPWEALLAFDTLIISLIIFNSYRHQAQNVQVKIPILGLIVRDGSIYFIVMGIVNLANIILLHLGRPFVRGSLTTTTTNFSVMMTCRLMLNLHEFSHVGIYGSAFPRDTTDTSLGFQFTTRQAEVEDIPLTDICNLEPWDERRSPQG